MLYGRVICNFFKQSIRFCLHSLLCGITSLRLRPIDVLISRSLHDVYSHTVIFTHHTPHLPASRPSLALQLQGSSGPIECLLQASFPSSSEQGPKVVCQVSFPSLSAYTCRELRLTFCLHDTPSQLQLTIRCC